MQHNEKHSYEGLADAVIVNNAPVPESLLELYAEEHAAAVTVDEDELVKRAALVQGNMLLVKDGKIRHNFSRLARTIMRIGSEL